MKTYQMFLLKYPVEAFSAFIKLIFEFPKSVKEKWNLFGRLEVFNSTNVKEKN